MKSFEIDLYLRICIDGICDTISVVSRLLIPIPFCNQDGSFTLPGNGTLAGVLEQFAEDASNTAVDFILETLGIKVKLNTRFHMVCALLDYKYNVLFPLPALPFTMYRSI